MARIVRPPGRTAQYIGRLGIDSATGGRGIGNRLVDRFINEARGKGLTTVELDVYVHNPSAQRLYERLGFEVTPETPSMLRKDFGTADTHRRMVLAL